MKTKIFFTAALASVLLIGCSKPNPIHEGMESMGKSFKALRQAETLADKQQLIAEFEQHVLMVQKQQVKPEDQATFDEGIDKLLSEVQAVKAALEQGNIENIKPQLKALHDLEEEYHELLGVEDH